MMAILAETDVGSLTSIGALMANVGFSAVVAWYLLTRALPKMQDQFTASNEKLQVQFTASIEKLQEKHERNDEARRADGKAGLSAVLEHCERESTRRDEKYELEMGQTRKQLTDFGEILEEVRDGLLRQEARRRQKRPEPPKT